MSDMVFPVQGWTGQSCHVNPRRFNNPRPGGRRHAGCDIYAPNGSEVKAICAGKIVYVGSFYFNVAMVQIDHGPAIGTIIYGEIRPAGVQVGQVVSKGQLIGYIKRIVKPDGQSFPPMLHLEWYSQREDVPIIGAANQFPLPYRRRFVPKDPTALLDQLLALPN